MSVLFKGSKGLEADIDDLLDAVSEGMLVFRMGIADYLQGDPESFGDRIVAIDTLEGKVDTLRKRIENELYSQSLIPDHRGDVLGLLESIDDIIDIAKMSLSEFSVEHPEIPQSLHAFYNDLSLASTEAAEALVRAARAFFRNVAAIHDHLHKVKFYEREADCIEDRLKRGIFSQEQDLSLKMHLRDFAKHVGRVADAAESAADRLAIYAIKRSM